MTFAEILKHLDNDEKVRRTVWDKNEYINFNWCGRLRFSNAERCPLIKEDYMSDDWEIYDDKEYFYFWKALELMEQGKSVARKSWKCIDEGWIYLSSYEEDIFSQWYKDPEICGDYYILTRADLKAKDWYLVGEE